MNSEIAVLGSILLENTSIIGVSKHITHSDFKEPDNQVLFRTMVNMYDSHKAIDILTLSKALEEGGHGNRIAKERIIELIETVPTAINAEHYAVLVKDASIKEKLIYAGAKITEFAKTKPAEEAVERAQIELSKVAKQASKTEIKTLGEALLDAHKQVERIHKAGSRITGVSTGFPDLDNYLAGFHSRELVLLASRPAMGKTALAITFGVNAALGNKGVLVFSLEMDARQLGMRVLSQKSKVPLQSLRTAGVQLKDWPDIAKAASQHEDLPFWIVNESDLTIAQLRTVARDHASRHHVRIIIVDYIQLLRSPGAERREREVAEISAALKSLAKELDATVIGLSQLNRGLESRPDKRPNLGDLRESGGLEQDADVVMFIYRDAYYNKESNEENIAEIIVAKQRQGPCGTAKVRFIPSRTDFQPKEGSIGRVEAAVNPPPDIGKLVGEKGGIKFIREQAEDILTSRKNGKSNMPIAELWEEIAKRNGLPAYAEGAIERLKRALHAHGFWVAADGVIAIDYSETGPQ